MLRAAAPPARRRARRAAFTLVELLVVIAIIAILISLSAAAVIRVIGVQQSSNTKTELTTIESKLLKQWSAASERFRKETLPPANPALAGVYNNTVLPMAGGDPQRARVIWVKLRQKQEFPQTISEALNPAPMPPLDQYPNVLTQGFGFTAANTFPGNMQPAPQPWESSAMLLMALSRGEAGNQLTPSDLGVSSNLKEFPTGNPPPNPQLPTITALVDAWGTPLAFCRWPTGSPELNLGGPQPGNKNDPGDPTGLLTSPAWLKSPGATTFQQVCHPLPPPPAAGGEPQSYRLTPLVVSAGPDGGRPPLGQGLGLDPFTFAPSPPGNPAAKDDLYPSLNPNP